MMKRPGNILLSLMLSLMLVYVGSGIVLLKCCCDGSVSVMSAKECCEGSTAGNVKKPCMTLTVMKLSPVPAATHYEHQAPHFFVISSLFKNIFASPVFWEPAKTMTVAPGEVFHSPPRAYLALIRVLII